MKQLVWAILFSAISMPAAALSISNIDDEEHVVVVETTPGTKIMKRVLPGESVRSVANTGWIYLEDKPEGRLPIEPRDRLVIWNDGNLQIQMRRKDGDGGLF